MKNAALIGCAYLVAGVAVTMWSAHLASTGRPYFTGLASAPEPMNLGLTVAVWPIAAFVNARGQFAALPAKA